MLYYNYILKRDISIDELYENAKYISKENLWEINKYTGRNLTYVEDILDLLKHEMVDCNKVIINYKDELNIKDNSIENRYAAFVIDTKQLKEFELKIDYFTIENLKDEGYYPLQANVGTIKGIFNVSKTLKGK